jgi:hypothetical protein
MVEIKSGEVAILYTRAHTRTHKIHTTSIHVHFCMKWPQITPYPGNVGSTNRAMKRKKEKMTEEQLRRKEIL